MADLCEKPRVIAIGGPTATGKTALSVSLARRFDGEIISADSMQIYKGLTIGTAKASEEEFVASGAGVERFPVMYNDFVVVGPEEEGKYGDDIAACFNAIQEGKLTFVSRGDDSGTDKKEKKIWAALEIDPTENPDYIESGQGMGATITMADEKKAYCLTDRGTWLKFKNDADLNIELNIVCEGAKDLLNQYGVIAVNPEKFEGLNNEAANVFIEWICSDKVQELIGQYGVEEYGQALFTPNAGTDN